MNINEICDLLRKELYNNYEYGFYHNGRKYKPNMENGFDKGFYNSLITIYHVQDPIVTIKEKIATCNDAVMVMKKILDENNISSKILLVHNVCKNKFHTIIIFTIDEKVIYLELTPKSNKPYYGKELIYSNEEELKKMFKNQSLDIIDITNEIKIGSKPDFTLKLKKNKGVQYDNFE